MRWLGVLKVVLVLAAGFVVLGRAPGAWACSCVGYSTERETLDAAYANAKLVFTGTARSGYDAQAASPIKSSMDPIEWTFDVESSQKGLAANPQVVSSARDNASCGFTFTVGQRYQVFAYQNGSAYSTGECTGTHVITGGELSLPRAFPADAALKFSPVLPVGLLAVGALMLALAWRFRPRAS